MFFFILLLIFHVNQNLFAAEQKTQDPPAIIDKLRGITSEEELKSAMQIQKDYVVEEIFSDGVCHTTAKHLFAQMGDSTGPLIIKNYSLPSEFPLFAKTILESEGQMVYQIDLMVKDKPTWPPSELHSFIIEVSRERKFRILQSYVTQYTIFFWINAINKGDGTPKVPPDRGCRGDYQNLCSLRKNLGGGEFLTEEELLSQFLNILKDLTEIMSTPKQTRADDPPKDKNSIANKIKFLSQKIFGGVVASVEHIQHYESLSLQITSRHLK